MSLSKTARSDIDTNLDTKRVNSGPIGLAARQKNWGLTRVATAAEFNVVVRVLGHDPKAHCAGEVDGDVE